MEMKATDLSARLLATENLSVVRGRVRTASFDIKSRVLTLPMWKDMTPEIEDMLIGHEVGHALYTGEKYIEPIRETPKLMSYLNIVEDVRIEKLIKRKYPGLRKRMNEGYKQLNERDFFGVKQVQNFEDLLLIDKINLYFKAGFQCGVKFNADEKVFVTRAEQTETVEDVIQLAQDIYAYSKEQAEQRNQRMKQESSEENEEGEDPQDPDDFDYDDDTVDEEMNDRSAKTASGRGSDDSEQDLESKTERAFQSKLDDLADDSTSYTYWKFSDTTQMDAVVSYKHILNTTKTPEQWLCEDRQQDYRLRYMSDEEYQKYLDTIESDFQQFKTESIRTVNYLVKEFEMRKSASLLKRAQISKMGSLDMRKVYAYKMKDDLFKRVTTLPQGKNHGMLMLVDWSGSMDRVIGDTLKQVINLVMFCQRVQIPYRVLAFTSSYSDVSLTTEERIQKRSDQNSSYRKLSESGENYIIANGFHMLELFSNKMTSTEFNSMARRVTDPRFFWNDGYSLGGTPLNEALVWCYQNIGSYIKTNQIEKMTFITLTDGDGSQFTTTSYRIEEYTSEVVNNTWTRIRQKHFIRDDVTQKTYELKRSASSQANTVLSMIKDRYGLALVGFHICENNKGALRSFLHSALPDFAGDQWMTIDAWKKEFKTNGFVSIKNTGRDELFLIPQSSTKIQDIDLDIASDASSRTIAKNFGKYLNVKKTSRVLLNKFIGLVA